MDAETTQDYQMITGQKTGEAVVPPSQDLFQHMTDRSICPEVLVKHRPVQKHRVNEMDDFSRSLPSP